MKSGKEIDKNIQDTLNSLDGVTRAQPAPYLFTRVQAKMNRVNESAWERAVRFVARPAVAFVGLALVVSINIIVITQQKAEPDKNALTEQQVTADEFSSSLASLYDDTENIEP